MAILTVNNVAMSPTSLEIGIMDISKAERNAKGNMIIERINTKRKLNLAFAYLNATDLKTILEAVAPTLYNVQYFDPQINGMVTGTFYCGDRNISIVKFTNGVPTYKDVTFDLVER